MELETINKLYLELSQFATATTKRELDHLEKWKEVIEMLRAKHPTSSVTLWVEGYVHGLKAPHER